MDATFYAVQQWSSAVIAPQGLASWIRTNGVDGIKGWLTTDVGVQAYPFMADLTNRLFSVGELQADDLATVVVALLETPSVIDPEVLSFRDNALAQNPALTTMAHRSGSNYLFWLALYAGAVYFGYQQYKKHFGSGS